MNNQRYLFSATLFVLFLFSVGAKAQIAAGGVYTIEKSVVANGGASGNAASAGGVYKIEGTIGQSAAGTKQQNAGLTFQPGFWNAAATNIAPTAANVSVSGRVLTADGSGIRNALVSLTTANGETRSVLSGKLGSYRFTDLPTGATYILRVQAKRFTFSQPAQILSIIEDTGDINFIADVSNPVIN